MKWTNACVGFLIVSMLVLCGGKAGATTSVTVATLGSSSTPAGIAVRRQFSNVGSNVTAWDAPGTGTYTVSFSGMWSPNLPHNIQVHTFGILCAPTNEGGINNDLGITIQCYTPEGQPKDLAPPAVITIIHRRDDSPIAGHFAYARNIGNNVVYSWNSRGGVNSLTHSSTGHYAFRFGSVLPTATGGTALVTTRTPFTRCSIVNWLPTTPAGTEVNVVCTKTGTSIGVLSDANLSVYFGEKPMISSGDWAFAWADQPSFPSPPPATYVPNTFYQGMSNGQQVRISRGSPGFYTVRTTGLHNGTAGAPFRFVTTYGDPDIQCEAGASLPDSFPVTCASNGAHLDTRFVVNSLAP